MLMFIWMCVVTSAYFPGGERLVAHQTQAAQAHVRASIEAPQVMTLGWSSR